MYYESKVHRTVNVSKSYFWKRIRAFGDIKTLLPRTIKEVKLPEDFTNSPGDVRFVYLEKVYQGEVIERLDGFSEESFISYSVIDKSCLPVENYVCTININYGTKDTTDIIWCGHFKADESRSDEMINAFKFNYNLICDNMEKQYLEIKKAP